MRHLFRFVGRTAVLVCMTQNIFASDDMFEESLEDIMQMETEMKTDVGSRDGAKNFLDSHSAIDVITAQQIEHSGLTSLTDILRYFVAGFNAPQTSVADGSDHIRAFTLRNMSPDQVLVLINGKRVHTSALLHVNDTIGRGSSNVDFDTIAPISIERIEVLRDGAAAQYGSDAISGVINIVLKGYGYENLIKLHGGKRRKGDGALSSASLFYSYPLRYDGFMNFSFQAKKQESTNRAGNDPRVTPPVVTTHAGLPESKNYLGVLNIDMPQQNGFDLYANVTFNYRESKAGTFFRPFNDDVNTTLLYPNGFLPMMSAKISDMGLTAGFKGQIDSKTSWDLSNVYGQNKIHYYLDNTMNYSLGAVSPTSFDNGELNFIQNTSNLDIKKEFDNFKLSGGLEYRYELYRITAGDIDSYVNGGSQGFSGYTPLNNTKANRNSYAAYLDGTLKFLQKASAELAARYENYSDFGATSNVKLSLKHKTTDQLLLRTTVSTGFRAPSLAQSNYSHTSTFGGLIEGTFKPDSEVAKLFGAKSLKPEKSEHFTLGSVYRFGAENFIMVDYFYTQVKDRIMLSNDFALSSAQQLTYGINKARFFTNAVNTKTQGIDVKFEYKRSFENDSNLDLQFWYNYVQNKVTGFNDASTTAANSYAQIDRIENGQPSSNLRVWSLYTLGKVDSTFNISRFGSYSQVINNVAYKFDPRWTFDLDVAYKFSKFVSIAIGGNNIFDAVPNKWNGLSGVYYGYDGIKPYSRFSPFGYSGSYYYIRTSIEF